MSNTAGFYPEGTLIDSPENKYYLRSTQTLSEAFLQGRTLEARAVVCTAAHDLVVDLGCMKGVIPRSEGAVGIFDGSVRDIALISRVNKPVCFRIVSLGSGGSGSEPAILSRRAVQEDCMRLYTGLLHPGDVIPARVTHMEHFGCFVDIGCGVISLIPIDLISISRISHPSDRFFVGQSIFAVVRSIEDGRITLSHKELLGNWEENVAGFCCGETVAGTVRSVEKYGVFVELAPNLAGLAEPGGDLAAGDRVSVYIKSVIPEKMKVKLVVIDRLPRSEPPRRFDYPDVTHISRWRYSPASCPKVIESVFDR